MNDCNTLHVTAPIPFSRSRYRKDEFHESPISRLIYLRKRRGRLVLAISALAVFFATAAVLQHWFVHAHLYRAITNELSLWARAVSKEVAYNDKWDLEGYRRARSTL